MVLGPFAETKEPRLPGRNPALITNANNFHFMNVDQTMLVPVEQSLSFLKFPPPDLQ